MQHCLLSVLLEVAASVIASDSKEIIIIIIIRVRMRVAIKARAKPFVVGERWATKELFV